MKTDGTCMIDNKSVKPTMICQDFIPKGHSKESDCQHCKFYQPSKQIKRQPAERGTKPFQEFPGRET